MDKQTKRRLEQIDKEFSERLKWITSKEYEIPERYVELCDAIRKYYLKFVDDVYKRIKRTKAEKN